MLAWHSKMLRCVSVSGEEKLAHHSLKIRRNVRFGFHSLCWVSCLFLFAVAFLWKLWQLIDRKWERWRARRTPETKAQVVKSHCSRSLTMEEFPSIVRNIFFIPGSEGPGKENTLVRLHASSYTQKTLKQGGELQCLFTCVCRGYFVVCTGCSGRCLVMSLHTLIKFSLLEFLQLSKTHTHTRTHTFLHTGVLFYWPPEKLINCRADM